MAAFLVVLSQELNCSVFAYDYSGYGLSTGQLREKNLYADIEAAWRCLRDQLVSETIDQLRFCGLCSSASSF